MKTTRRNIRSISLDFAAFRYIIVKPTIERETLIC